MKTERKKDKQFNSIKEKMKKKTKTYQQHESENEERKKNKSIARKKEKAKKKTKTNQQH